jgi:hypothetical protein
METFAVYAEHAFLTLAQMGVTLLEFCGVLVLVIASVKALVGYFRKDARVRLNLAQGIALALEFKLGGEVLRTTWPANERAGHPGRHHPASWCADAPDQLVRSDEETKDRSCTRQAYAQTAPLARRGMGNIWNFHVWLRV